MEHEEGNEVLFAVTVIVLIILLGVSILYGFLTEFQAFAKV
jgi:hypothetical protein